MTMINATCKKCGKAIVGKCEISQGLNFVEKENGDIELFYANAPGEYYCMDCFEQEFDICSICTNMVPRAGTVQYNGDVYCPHCAETYLATCPWCGQLVSRENMRTVYSPTDEGRWEEEHCCIDCLEEQVDSGNFIECSCCHDYFPPSFAGNRTTDGNLICNSCARDDYTRCDVCGYYCENGYVHHDENGLVYCEECYNRILRVIHGYHRYSHEFVHVNPDRDKNMSIGIELEIDGGGTSNNKAITITSAIGFPANKSNQLICSRDGSLRNGFEIISQPCTFEKHLTYYNWKAGLETARKNGYTSHSANTCGIHYHVDRRYFADSMCDPEAAAIILMVNNAGWLEDFSRRTYFGYCEFYHGEPFTKESFVPVKEKGEVANTDKIHEAMSLIDDLKSEWRDHYHCVNFRNNPTIEFRFIRGTLKYSTFVASLQLIEMIGYAMKHFREEQLATINLRWFMTFAKRRNYTEFLTYLRERNIRPQS